VSNPSRVKGTTWEAAVVDFLKPFWPWVERRALNGSKDRGDVAGIPFVVIEAKAAKTMRLNDWLAELDDEIVAADAGTGAVFVKRIGRTKAEDGFIVMRPLAWVELMKRAEW